MVILRLRLRLRAQQRRQLLVALRPVRARRRQHFDRVRAERRARRLRLHQVSREPHALDHHLQVRRCQEGAVVDDGRGGQRGGVVDLLGGGDEAAGKRLDENDGDGWACVEADLGHAGELGGVEGEKGGVLCGPAGEDGRRSVLKRVDVLRGRVFSKRQDRGCDVRGCD